MLKYVFIYLGSLYFPIGLGVPISSFNYFVVTSPLYASKILDSSAVLRTVRVNFDQCTRQCMIDGSCWALHSYMANGTNYCVLFNTNLCRQPGLNLINTTLSTALWEKLESLSKPCVSRSYTYDDCAKVGRAGCTGTWCKQTCIQVCSQCNLTTGGQNLGFYFERNGIYCTLWPSGPNGPSVYLPCIDEIPVLISRNTTVNSTHITELVLTPQQIYLIRQAHSSLTTFEVQFWTTAEVLFKTWFSGMSVDSNGSLSIQSFDEYNPDGLGVPVINAPFITTAHPSCGPNWNFNKSTIVAGTPFGFGPCPGGKTAFLGTPGFYNGTWCSGMAYATVPINEVIVAVMVYIW